MADQTKEFSLIKLFTPLTNSKAIHLIVIIGLVVFANTLVNGFVWDDLTNILYNPSITTIDIPGAFTRDIGGMYRPLVELYFALLYAPFKTEPFFYHVANLTFHIINATLVFLLFRKFFTVVLSMFLALIFLVHPIQVESVAWVAVSGNIYFFFGMLALLLGLREQLAPKRVFIIGILMLLSLLAKETGILFLGFLFLYRLLFMRHRQLLLVFGIGVVTTVTYLFIRLVIGEVSFHPQSAITPMATLPFMERMLSLPAIVFFYLKTFFFPKDLVIMQHWVVTVVTIQSFWIPLFLSLSFFLSLTGYGVLLKQKKSTLFPMFLFFMGWFSIGLLPHLQLTALDMTVADRWFYLPIIGLLGVIGTGCALSSRKNKTLQLFLILGGILILSVLSMRTIARNANWQNDLTLYLHDRQVLTNFVIENNIGWNYQQQNQLHKALPFYENSVNLNPHWAISLNNLGYTYERLGNKTKARATFYRTLDASDYTEELYHRDLVFTSWVLTTTDTPAIVRDFTQKALRKDPESAPLWAYLAIAEYRLKNDVAARVAIRKTLGLSAGPAYDDFYNRITAQKPLPEVIPLLEN